MGRPHDGDSPAPSPPARRCIVSRWPASAAGAGVCCCLGFGSPFPSLDPTMQIVILDGYTANPGDLSWAELEALAPCSVFDTTDAHAVISRIGAAEIVLTNKTPLPADVLAALPHLQLISVLGTSYNVVDVAAARAPSRRVAPSSTSITCLLKVMW